MRIPIDDADEMLDSLCEKPIIEKTRYRVSHQGFVWEVDEFAGDNAGLIVAEIELASEDQEFSSSILGRPRGDRRSPLFQCQPDRPSVQGLVETHVRRLMV